MQDASVARFGADVCVVVPMHNERAVIAQTCAGLSRFFELIVCVDDGSSDGSAEMATAAGAVVVRHPVNLGQGAAIQTGLTYALTRTSAAHIVSFDADGQHDPADAARLVAAARDHGASVILGSRFLGAPCNLPPSRRLLLRVATAFTRLTTGLALTDTHNGLRVFSRDAAAGLRIRHNGMAHASEILDHIGAAGLSYREEPVTVSYTEYSRSKGQSNLNALNIAIDIVTTRLYSHPR